MRQKKIVISWVKQVKKKSTKFSFLYQNVGVNKKKVTKILHQFTNYSREFSKINSRYLNILQNGVRKTHKKVCRNESVEIAGKNWFLKTTLTFWTLTNGSMGSLNGRQAEEIGNSRLKISKTKTIPRILLFMLLCNTSIQWLFTIN